MPYRKSIEERVRQAAEEILSRQHFVSPIALLIEIGWLQPVQVKAWQKGKVPVLEKVIQASLGKISRAMKCFQNWGIEKHLKASQTIYLASACQPQRHLRFSLSGAPTIETAYRTHYISPALSEKKQQRLQEKLNKPPERVVFSILKNSQCAQCKKALYKSSFLFMEVDKPLCLACAGFGDLVFLPAGHAKLTRQAKQYSATVLVVVRFSRTRKRYERQGILIQPKALDQAERELAHEVA